MIYSELDLTVDPYEPADRNTSQAEQVNSDTKTEKNNNAPTSITLSKVPEIKWNIKSTIKHNIGKNNIE